MQPNNNYTMDHGDYPSSWGYVSLIEWHIEDGFPVSSGFVCLNETHSDE